MNVKRILYHTLQDESACSLLRQTMKLIKHLPHDGLIFDNLREAIYKLLRLSFRPPGLYILITEAWVPGKRTPWSLCNWAFVLKDTIVSLVTSIASARYRCEGVRNALADRVSRASYDITAVSYSVSSRESIVPRIEVGPFLNAFSNDDEGSQCKYTLGCWPRLPPQGNLP